MVGNWAQLMVVEKVDWMAYWSAEWKAGKTAFQLVDRSELRKVGWLVDLRELMMVVGLEILTAERKVATLVRPWNSTTALMMGVRLVE